MTETLNEIVPLLLVSEIYNGRKISLWTCANVRTSPTSYMRIYNIYMRFQAIIIDAAALINHPTDK